MSVKQTTSSYLSIQILVIRAVSKKCWNLITFFIIPFRGKAEHQLLKDTMNILICPFSWVLVIPSYPKCQRWGLLTTISIYKKHETITFQSNLICIGRIPFLRGFNLKKLNSANYTGLNLKNNSNMVVRVKPLYGTDLYTTDNGTDTGLMPDKMYIVIEHECILEIKAQSVIFYD